MGHKTVSVGKHPNAVLIYRQSPHVEHEMSAL